MTCQRSRLADRGVHALTGVPGRPSAVRLAGAVGAAILILTVTAPTAPLFAQPITEIIDSTGDGTNGLYRPVGIAVDSADNVYVTGDGSVFKITPGGTVTQIIDSTGDGTNGFRYPGGVAVDSADNVYVTGALSDNAFKITPRGAVTQIIDSTGDGTNGLDFPLAVAVDSADNVYVVGFSSYNVFKITPRRAITQIIDSTNGLGSAPGVAVDSADNVYVAGLGSVFKITPGGTITQIIIRPIGLRGVGAVAVDSADNVYVTGDGSVFKMTPDGTVTRIGDFEGPFSVAVDSAGNVYVSGGDVGCGPAPCPPQPTYVFKITPGGTITQIIDSTGDGTNNLDEPVGIAVDSADNVYVTGAGSNNVFKIALAQPCTGDCGENGVVKIHELITLVNIALGLADVSRCEAGDRDLDREISIDEILSAVGYDLAGCPLIPVARACVESGGELTTGFCCLATGDFPDTCGIGPCGCGPEDSHEVRICDCGPGSCFDGSECVEG